MNYQVDYIKSNSYSSLSKSKEIDKTVFYLCLIDILFIPYAFFVAVSYSFFILMPWLVIRHRRIQKKYKEFKIYLLFIVLVIISTVMGIIVNGSMEENISQGIRIIQILGYYFLFRNYLDENRVNIKAFMMLFCIFVVFFCFIYNLDKHLYSQIIRLWNPRGLSMAASLYKDLSGYRYCFLWMDPNNIAYMFVGIVTFILTNEKTEFVSKIILVMGLLFVLISSMSSGGIISLIVESVVLIVLSLTKKKQGRLFVVKLKTFFTMLLLPAIIYFIKRIWDSYSQSTVALESFDRFNDNSVNSRLEIYKRIIFQTNFILYIFIGYGGVTYVGGVIQKPHNGHLYLILAFGMIAYFIFMYIVFRKRHITPVYNYIWIIPIFLGFSANVLLGEVKLSAIIMLMVACSSSEKYLADRDNIFVGETKDEG